MRTIMAACLAPLAVVFAAGAAASKTHKYQVAKLPGVVKARVGDRIVLLEEVNPKKVEEVVGQSDNADVKVKTELSKGKLRIVITGAKKGTATVKWQYLSPDGRVGAGAKLRVKIE
jgi:hypothetical protein